MFSSSSVARLPPDFHVQSVVDRKNTIHDASSTALSTDRSFSSFSEEKYPSRVEAAPSFHKDPEESSPPSCSSSTSYVSTADSAGYIDVYSAQHKCKFKLVFKSTSSVSRLRIIDIKKHLEKATCLPPDQQCLVDMKVLRVLKDDFHVSSSLLSGGSLRLVPLIQGSKEDTMEMVKTMLNSRSASSTLSDVSCSSWKSSSSRDEMNDSPARSGSSSSAAEPQKRRNTPVAFPSTRTHFSPQLLSKTSSSAPPQTRAVRHGHCRSPSSPQDSREDRRAIQECQPTTLASAVVQIPSSSSSETVPQSLFSSLHTPSHSISSVATKSTEPKKVTFSGFQVDESNDHHPSSEQRSQHTSNESRRTEVENNHNGMEEEEGRPLPTTGRNMISSSRCNTDNAPNAGPDTILNRPERRPNTAEVELRKENEQLRIRIKALERRCKEAEYEAANAVSDWKLEEALRNQEAIHQKTKEEQVVYMEEMEARWMFKENELIRELDRAREDRRKWQESRRALDDAHAKQRTTLEVALSFREKEIKEKDVELRHLRGELAVLQNRVSPDEDDAGEGKRCAGHMTAPVPSVGGAPQGENSDDASLFRCHMRKTLDVLPSPSSTAVLSREELCFDQLVEESLSVIGETLRMADPIVLSEQLTAVLDVKVDSVCGDAVSGRELSPFSSITLLLTVDTEAERLFLYSTLLNYLPPRLNDQHRLYERLLEGALLGREIAGGTIGISKERQLVLLSISVDIRHSNLQEMSVLLPPFVKAVRTWTQFLREAFPPPPQSL